LKPDQSRCRMVGLSRGRPVKAPILLALAGLSISTAQAAERAVVLACEGKVTQPPGPKPEPVSIGIIINFTAGTVTWADSSDFPLTITRLNEMSVDFRGSNGSPYRQHKPQDGWHGRDFHTDGGLKKRTASI
jgi:hypothetical protein